MFKAGDKIRDRAIERFTQGSRISDTNTFRVRTLSPTEEVYHGIVLDVCPYLSGGEQWLLVNMGKEHNETVPASLIEPDTK